MPNAVFCNSAGFGNEDKRHYVNWSDSQYHKIVSFNGDSCTAQYVWPNIILTARHCVDDKDKNVHLGDKFPIKLYDKQYTPDVILEAAGPDNDDGDWALLRITDPRFYRDDYYEVNDKTETQNLTNAGFGWCRPLDKHDYDVLKKFYDELYPEYNIFTRSEMWQEVIKKAEDSGIKKLDDYDYNNHIPLLKADSSDTCRIDATKKSDGTARTYCDTTQGNSGGPYFSGNKLNAIVSRGRSTFSDETYTDWGTRTETFIGALNDFKNKYPKDKLIAEMTNASGAQTGGGSGANSDAPLVQRPADPVITGPDNDGQTPGGATGVNDGKPVTQTGGGSGINAGTQAGGGSNINTPVPVVDDTPANVSNGDKQNGSIMLSGWNLAQSMTMNIGEIKTINVLHSRGNLSASSSDTNIVGVQFAPTTDATGTLTLTAKSAGNATITFTIPETDRYKSVTKEGKVVVSGDSQNSGAPGTVDAGQPNGSPNVDTPVLGGNDTPGNASNGGKQDGVVTGTSQFAGVDGNSSPENDGINTQVGSAEIIYDDVHGPFNANGIVEKRDALEQEINSAELDVENMSVGEMAGFVGSVIYLNHLDDLIKKHQLDVAREKALPNRILDAVAIGATGIGGMMAASALSEKKADEDAERDMRAWLNTYRCEYGNGGSVRGGETDVELPGGNDMVDLHTQYATLAKDLKDLKEALGLKPGIESEVVINKEDTGLYNDVGTGVTGGAYASIARALRDPDGEDAKMWNLQKKQTDKKLKIGAGVAGAGAIGGFVGNVVINGWDGQSGLLKLENDTESK